MSLPPEYAETLKSKRTTPSAHQFSLIGDPGRVFQVRGNLWIGSAPPIGDSTAKYFDCLVLCAKEYQVPECFPGVQVALAYLDDSGRRMTEQERSEATRASGKVIRWLSEGFRVLVTCQQGRNRSGLVCALSLICGTDKMEANDAINLVRMARGHHALSNDQFVDFIHKFSDFQTRKKNSQLPVGTGI